MKQLKLISSDTEVMNLNSLKRIIKIKNESSKSAMTKFSDSVTELKEHNDFTELHNHSYINYNLHK